MEELTLITPTFLFSAVSLILLAYTNRFLSYAQLVRTLKDRYMEDHSAMTHAQIMNLKKKALSDQKHANVWCGQFIALCCYYVSDLYWLTYIVGLYFWVSFAVAHYIAWSFGLGNTNFGQIARNLFG
jgi:hypothetical protein